MCKQSKCTMQMCILYQIKSTDVDYFILLLQIRWIASRITLGELVVQVSDKSGQLCVNAKENISNQCSPILWTVQLHLWKTKMKLKEFSMLMRYKPLASSGLARTTDMSPGSGRPSQTSPATSPSSPGWRRLIKTSPPSPSAPSVGLTRLIISSCLRFALTFWWQPRRLWTRSWRQRVGARRKWCTGWRRSTRRRTRSLTWSSSQWTSPACSRHSTFRSAPGLRPRCGLSPGWRSTWTRRSSASTWRSQWTGPGSRSSDWRNSATLASRHAGPTLASQPRKSSTETAKQNHFSINQQKYHPKNKQG